MNKWIYIFLINIIIVASATGQCFSDRHNTTWYDSWVSCTASQNPNQERGVTHWIMYDLGYTYHLGKSHFWNLNAVDFLQDGIQSAVIDLSVDGINWQEVAVFDLEQAPGISTYEGFEGPDLSGLEAKYVLITALSNYGGECFGFGELKIGVNGITKTPDFVLDDKCLDVRIFPNPVSDNTKVDVITTCNKENVGYQLLDLTGKVLLEGAFQPISEISPVNLNFSELDAGTYFFYVNQNGNVTQEKIIKLK